LIPVAAFREKPLLTRGLLTRKTHFDLKTPGHPVFYCVAAFPWNLKRGLKDANKGRRRRLRAI
jgi:hypothetical protein